MAESNRAEHQHKVEETPSEAILRHNKLSNNCSGDLWSTDWFYSTVSANFQM